MARPVREPTVSKMLLLPLCEEVTLQVGGDRAPTATDSSAEYRCGAVATDDYRDGPKRPLYAEDDLLAALLLAVAVLILKFC